MSHCCLLNVAVFVVLASLIWLYDRIRKQTPKEFTKDNSYYCRMGVMSQLWQRMYVQRASPIVHGMYLVHINEPNKESTNIPQLYAYVVEFFQELVNKYLTLRSIPVLIENMWYWKELKREEVDVQSMVSHIEIDSSKLQIEQSQSRQDVCMAAFNEYLNEARYIEKCEFDENKPRWDALFLTLLHHHDYALMVAKFHHGIGDGVLMTRVMEHTHQIWGDSCTQVHQQPSKKSGDSSAKSRKNGTRALNWRQIWGTLTSWAMFLYYVLYNTLDFAKFFVWESPRDMPVELNNLMHTPMARRYQTTFSRPMKVDVLKKMAHSYNGTLNDLIMTLFCSGIHRYLKKKKSKALEKQGKDLRVRFISIFNLRSLLTRDLDTLVKSFEDGKAENDLAMLPIRLPVGPMSFEERFKDIQSCFNIIKKGGAPMIGLYLIKLLYALGGVQFVDRCFSICYGNCGALLSNLRGPRSSLRFGGKDANDKRCCNEVKHVFNTTNPTHIPLTIGIESYMNALIIAMTCDENTSETPNELMECINEEMNQISGVWLRT